jgi:hypothetical protein
MPVVRADGRPYIAVPPRAAAVRPGPTSSLHQLRELAERHARGDDIRWRVPPRRAGADLRTPKRRPVRIREPRRPAIAHSRPTARRDPGSSAPRLHAAPVQVVAIGGRDGNGERDDGSGSGDYDGGCGGGSDPALERDIARGAL